MPRIHAGLGGDVDESEACVVILGRVGIHAKTNLANLRLRRQLAAAKTVHADLCAWSGELVDGVLEFVRVVGELCDLFGSQDVAERWSIRVGVAYLRFFGDVDEEAQVRNTDRKSTRLNSSHVSESRMPSSA